MKFACNFIIQHTRNLHRAEENKIYVETIFYILISCKTEGKRSIFLLDACLALAMLYHGRLSTCPLL